MRRTYGGSPSTACGPFRHVYAGRVPGTVPRTCLERPGNSPVSGRCGRFAPGTVPGHVCLGLDLAVPVVDRVGEAEELAGRPRADLVRVGIHRRRDRQRGSTRCRRGRSRRCGSSPCVRPPRRPGRTRSPTGRSSCSPSGVRSVGRPASTISHSSSPVLVVVRADALAGRQLVDRKPELLAAEQRAEPRYDVW